MYLLFTLLLSIGKIILLLWGQHDSEKEAHLALLIDYLMSFNDQCIAVVVIVFSCLLKNNTQFLCISVY